VAVVLTLVQTKQIRINIHKQYKYTVQTIQIHSTNNTNKQYKQYKYTVQTIQIHSTNNTNTQYKQYKYTVQTIQNTVNTSKHITKTPTHTHAYTLQNKSK
jgi:hypothetical protein